MEEFSEEYTYVSTDVFTEAMERLELSKSAFSEIHQNYIDDIKFGLLGEQWDAQILTDRQNEKRTTSTFNKLAPMIRNVVNTALKNPPAIKVHPISNANKETAKIHDGLIKHIQSESNSEAVYNSTLQDAVAGGIGIFEIVTVDNIYNGQTEIQIKRIVDPTSVFPDPEAIEPDFSDMKWLFHVKTMSKKAFEKEYPGFDCMAIDSSKQNWFSEDSVSIAEYWVKKDDGTVCWYILNGNEIIDSSDSKTDEFGNPTPYPGKYIPYCIVVGEDVYVDGKRTIKSLIRDVKDMQRTLNYMQSEAIDYVSKNAKAPYLASDKSIGPYKDLWAQANKRNIPYLTYVDGANVPQRMDPPPPPVGYVESISRLDTDIRQSIGIRDPLQDIPATQSGKAIQLQLSESNVSTYIWHDHLNRAIKLAGRIIIDLIPYYYNYPHVQQILGIDGSVETVQIKQPYFENGAVVSHDLSGEYGITISTGASYTDQRKETFDNLMELAKVDPRILQFAGDIILRKMDFAESNEIADRFQALIPPQVLQSSKLGNEQQMKQHIMAQTQQLEQAMAMIDKLTQTLNIKSQEVESVKAKLVDKSDAAQIKAQTDLQKQAMDNRNELEKTEIQSRAALTEATINAEKDLKIKELELQIEALKAMNQPTFL